MASSVRYILERGNHRHLENLLQQAGGTNETLALIQNLVFAETKSIRTSTIILAAFNVLAALGTALSILYDCYWASKRCNPNFRASKFCVSSIHPAETFPLLLAIGIVIQGLVFAGVQGLGLQSLQITSCTTVGQVVWPALFIVPYLTLVFGLECAIRSLRKSPFQARGKYDVSICCVVVVLMLIGTWIPSHFYHRNSCKASLVWLTAVYGENGFILLATVAGSLLISAVTIFIRLSRVHMIDPVQRVAASRMVYYLVLGLVSLAFIIPFYFSLVNGNGDKKAAMIATVVLNLSGLMSGLLQLFLRSNTATTSFGPKQERSWARAKHEIRIWGPNELTYGGHFAEAMARSPTARAEEGRHSQASLTGPEKFRMSMDSQTSPSFRPTTPIKQTRPLQDLSSPNHDRTQSYSLFPGKPTTPMNLTSAQSKELLEDLAPPPPTLFGSRHRRDSSVASSATVQIGLRISHALSPSLENLGLTLPMPLPSTTYKPNATRGTPYLQVRTQDLSKPVIPVRAPFKASPLTTNVTNSQPSPTQVVSMNKELPPTPAPAPAAETSPLQLSPTVYTPPGKKQTTSPQPATDPMRSNPVNASAKLSSSNSSEPPTRRSKLDWI